MVEYFFYMNLGQFVTPAPLCLPDVRSKDRKLCGQSE